METLDIFLRGVVISVIVKPRQGNASPRTLATIKRQLVALGITHQMVADEAAKTARVWRGRQAAVNPATVSAVLACAKKSANIVTAAKRLIAAAPAQQRKAS